MNPMPPPVKEYTNGEITVIWQAHLCQHSAHCYKELLAVFNPEARPWINMAGAPNDRITQQVNRCPSGTLTYLWED